MPALTNCRAAAYGEIFHLLADAADPVLARLPGDGAGSVHDLMLTAGRVHELRTRSTWAAFARASSKSPPGTVLTFSRRSRAARLHWIRTRAFDTGVVAAAA